MIDYYQILEVDSNPSQELIREQYRFLVHAWHPDKFPNTAQKTKAEERIKEINAAYEVLRDPTKRTKYDRIIQSTSNKKEYHHQPHSPRGQSQGEKDKTVHKSKEPTLLRQKEIKKLEKQIASLSSKIRKLKNDEGKSIQRNSFYSTTRDKHTSFTVLWNTFIKHFCFSLFLFNSGNHRRLVFYKSSS